MSKLVLSFFFYLSMKHREKFAIGFLKKEKNIVKLRSVNNDVKYFLEATE